MLCIPPPLLLLPSTVTGGRAGDRGALCFFSSYPGISSIREIMVKKGKRVKGKV